MEVRGQQHCAVAVLLQNRDANSQWRGGWMDPSWESNMTGKLLQLLIRQYKLLQLLIRQYKLLQLFIRQYKSSVSPASFVVYSVTETARRSSFPSRLSICRLPNLSASRHLDHQFYRKLFQHLIFRRDRKTTQCDY
jgi:hypothetical protein